VTADDLIRVGRVARAHGNRGQVIVNPETDFADERFRVGRIVMVGPDGRDGPRAIQSVRFHQGRPIVALAGVDSMDAAEALAGAELWMTAADLAPLPHGTFYHHDLVGCEVRGADGTAIGTVTGVEGPLERSLLVVEGPAGETLIPMVDGICVRIDVSRRQIVANLPEGLLELNLRQNRPRRMKAE
jgi:16S rRNA processing protein RimM